MNAIDILMELQDMDHRDYIETMSDDLEYIQAAIDQYGAMAALDKLMAYFE